ncbi:hypothetical protein NQZ68_033776 [Dissostichus eleginoides]|nr:hypothetical protein NQZ68_033776 [Dissostichus eleginoides]
MCVFCHCCGQESDFSSMFHTGHSVAARNASLVIVRKSVRNQLEQQGAVMHLKLFSNRLRGNHLSMRTADLQGHDPYVVQSIISNIFSECLSSVSWATRVGF